jgi:hypothetical protein
MHQQSAKFEQALEEGRLEGQEPSLVIEDEGQDPLQTQLGGPLDRGRIWPVVAGAIKITIHGAYSELGLYHR